MPSLPVDLERLIFEMAALQDTDHDNRVRISLVAKRVYEWIRPILYRIAIVTTPYGETLSIRNFRKVQINDIVPFTRHLSVSNWVFQDLLIQLLSTFRNVENLAIWSRVCLLGFESLEKLNDLPLRMLCVPNINLEGSTIEYRPAFRNISHLQLDYPNERTRDDCEALAKFPKLTHLCFRVAMAFDVDNERQVVLDLLKHCPSLRALIYLIVTYTEDFTTKSDDFRLLGLKDHFTCEDEWERSINGQIGQWELADVIIQARHNKLFEDTSLFSFSRETWMYRLNDDGMRWYKEWSRGMV